MYRSSFCLWNWPVFSLGSGEQGISQPPHMQVTDRSTGLPCQLLPQWVQSLFVTQIGLVAMYDYAKPGLWEERVTVGLLYHRTSCTGYCIMDKLPSQVQGKSPKRFPFSSV